ncbi:MAG TPA: phasin family protein [Stellaceae bacterium]
MIPNGKHTLFDMDLGKAFAGLAFPGFDVDSLAAAQRKNLEAFTQANQLAVEGAQAIARRQVELARQVMDEASAVMRDWTQPAAPEEQVAKNVELVTQAFEKSVANARELTELVAKANTDTFNVIHKRIAEGFEEIRDYTRQRAAR